MGDVARVLAITGTRREAAVLRRAGVRTVAIGGLAEGLDAVSLPVDAVISFGMAGALAPGLRIGDWVIGERVCGGIERQCDERWSTALARAIPAARTGPIYADGHLIADPAEKQSLHRLDGALAADMESHLAAAFAVRAAVPFAVLRCISDEAAHALPPAIAVAMRPDGNLALGAILGSILRNPAQLPALASTLAGFARAFGALKAGARSIPRPMGFEP